MLLSGCSSLQPLSQLIGGGTLLVDLGVEYVWLNQLLLLLKDGERIGPEEWKGYAQELPAWMENTFEGALRKRISIYLDETVDVYRQFRRTGGPSRLSQPEGASSADLRASLKDHLFPTLYKGSFLFLYNEVRHKKGSLAALEDSSRCSQFRPLFAYRDRKSVV